MLIGGVDLIAAEYATEAGNLFNAITDALALDTIDIEVGNVLINEINDAIDGYQLATASLTLNTSRTIARLKDAVAKNIRKNTAQDAQDLTHQTSHDEASNINVRNDKQYLFSLNINDNIFIFNPDRGLKDMINTNTNPNLSNHKYFEYHAQLPFNYFFNSNVVGIINDISGNVQNPPIIASTYSNIYDKSKYFQWIEHQYRPPYVESLNNSYEYQFNQYNKILESLFKTNENKKFEAILNSLQSKSQKISYIYYELFVTSSLIINKQKNLEDKIKKYQIDIIKYRDKAKFIFPKERLLSLSEFITKEYFLDKNSVERWDLMGASGLDSVIYAYDSLLMSIVPNTDSIKFNAKIFLFYSCLHVGDSDSTGAIGGFWFGALLGYNNFDTNKIKNIEFYDSLKKLSKMFIEVIK